jgi:hypothetical protein
LSKGKRKEKIAQKLSTAKRIKFDEHEETSSKPSSVNLRSGKSTIFLLNNYIDKQSSDKLNCSTRPKTAKNKDKSSLKQSKDAKSKVPKTVCKDKSNEILSSPKLKSISEPDDQAMSEEKNDNDLSRKSKENSENDQKESQHEVEHEVEHSEKQSDFGYQKSSLNSVHGFYDQPSNELEQDLGEKCSSEIEVSHTNKIPEEKEVPVSLNLINEEKQTNTVNQDLSQKSGKTNKDVQIEEVKDFEIDISPDLKNSTIEVPKDQTSKKSASVKK